MVTSLLPRATPRRSFISKDAPTPYVPPAKEVAQVPGAGRRAADDPRVKRKRRRKRVLLHPLPLKV
jgi:hypothetical protein